MKNFEKNKEVKLSVVVVNYNGKEYVDKCVKSVFASGFEEMEVIVVDNGSTDGSVEYLKDEYASFRDPSARTTADRA